MKAVFVTKTSREIVDREIPSPGAGEILVKNAKHVVRLDPYSIVEGNDIAGHVEAVGEGVTKFKKGDKVAAFTKMCTHDKYGAYAEYSLSPSNTAFHLGPNTAYEDAAALPLAYITAAIGLFKRLKLPEPEQEGDRGAGVLVYGGASTVGVYAIQLAKDVPKKYGADEVIDYRNKSSDELIDAIASSNGGKGVTYIYDAVTENGSTEASLGALVKQGRGGRYTYVLDLKLEDTAFPPATIHTERTLCATAHGEDADFSEKWFDWVGEALEKGEFRPQKVTVIPGGLAGVKEGLRRLEQGEVRGEKLVYRISETPGLS
ncbi:hypothetical protein JCM10449v2_003136 [Rhodotorula kratochvilovae]